MHIIETELCKHREGIYYRYGIYGLNLFWHNQVPIDGSADPRVILLREIVAHHPCTLHVEFEGFSTQDAFDYMDDQHISEFVEKTYNAQPTNITCISGFSYADDDPSFVIQHGTVDFIEAYAHTLLWYDSLAMYIADTPQQLELGMNQFADRESILARIQDDFSRLRRFEQFTHIWIEMMLDRYPLVFHTDEDGGFLYFYVKDPQYLQWITAPLQKALQSVKASSWFQANQEKFVWDDYHYCLSVADKS